MTQTAGKILLTLGLLTSIFLGVKATAHESSCERGLTGGPSGRVSPKGRTFPNILAYRANAEPDPFGLSDYFATVKARAVELPIELESEVGWLRAKGFRFVFVPAGVTAEVVENLVSLGYTAGTLVLREELPTSTRLVDLMLDRQADNLVEHD